MNSLASLFRLGLLLALGAATTRADVPSGLFDLKVKETADIVARLGLDRLAVLPTKEGYAIATKADATNWQVLGVMKEADSMVTLPVQSVDKTLVTLHIAGLKPKEFTGIIKIGGKEVPFVANISALGGFFRCGNHPQAHLADSIEQMRELTKANGCEQWKADTNAETGLAFDVKQFENVKILKF